MADIDVKPKTKTPAWAWIIVLAILVALLYFFLRGTGENTDKKDNGADSSTSILKESTKARNAAITNPAVSKAYIA